MDSSIVDLIKSPPAPDTLEECQRELAIAKGMLRVSEYRLQRAIAELEKVRAGETLCQR